MKSNEKLLRAIDTYVMSKSGLSPYYSSVGYRQSVQYGVNIRDVYLHKYSILPGAVQTFISVATSREWTVLGKPKSAARTVDRLNNSFFIDSQGLKHVGWEQMMARVCMDWLAVGRGMFHSKEIGQTGNWTPPEYMDVAYAYIDMQDRQKSKWKYYPNGRNTGTPRMMDQNNVFFIDNVRIGSSGVIAGSLAWLMSIAHLDWLLREHDSMQLDGRKIRDIIICNGEPMADAIAEGITMSIAMHTEDDPSKHNVPIVHADLMTEDGSVADQFARLGLSEIPRDFSRQELEGRYAREIAATLGLPIGQFWYDPRGTNRSLEQVQQERATLKGPSYYVRSFGRLLNQSPITGKPGAYKTLIQFEEETDNSSLKQKADAFKIYVEGLKLLNESIINIENLDVSLALNGESLLGIAQKLGFIPANYTLPNIISMEENTLYGRTVDEDALEQGWVRMDSSGLVLERRKDFMIQSNGWKKDEQLSGTTEE